MDRVGAAGARTAANSGRATSGAGFSQATFRKSSYSSYNGACVEVADLPSGVVGVWDSKDTGDGRILVVDAAA